MHKSLLIPASLLVVAAFFSCATAKPADSLVAETPAGVEVPAPAPVMAAEHYWALNRVETAYPDGMLSGVEEFSLDDTGRVVKDTLYDGKMNVVTVKSWSLEGDRASLEITDATGTLIGKGSRVWVGGLLAEETRLTPKGETQSTERYEYDAEGRKVRWSVQTAQGSTVTTDYGWVGGNLAVISVKDSTGTEIKHFERSYNAAGVPLAEEELASSGILVRRVSYASEGGFVVAEETRNGTGGLVSSVTYENDENGNPVTVKFYDRSGRLIETRTQAWTGFTRLVPQK